MSPSSENRDALGDALGGVVYLALILNGDLAAFVETNTSFSYYLAPAASQSAAVQVSVVMPVAGPSAGGSVLDVRGQGFRFLGGVLCRFGLTSRTVPGTIVNASLVRCVSPPISNPLGFALAAGGQKEFVEVTLNGQDYTSSLASFVAFDKSRVHVSSLVPFGGPLSGGTEVILLGSGFVDYNSHCQIGAGGPLVRAEVLNASALSCTMPMHAQAELVAIEVTLNNDTSAHTLTSDGVTFDYFNASGVRIDSIAPLGGPSDGGTVVTLSGSGYVDRGGVFCRFGANPALTVEASIRSTGEVICTSPRRLDSDAAIDAPPRYALVHPAASCCAAHDEVLTRLGGVPPGGAATPSDCEAGCNVLAACRFFSHSQVLGSCDFCADCAANRSDASSGFASWQRLGPQTSDVEVRLILDGLTAGTLLPEPGGARGAPVFTYYLPQSLVVSSVWPLGGPIAGGTVITLHGEGFAPFARAPAGGGGSVLCRFGALSTPQPATVSGSGASMICASPMQPDASASEVSVGAIMGGSGLPPHATRGISHRWTVDGCDGVGASHARECARVADARAAVTCCARDGASCQSMCVSPFDAASYPRESPAGLTNAFVTYDEAVDVCEQRMMRLCTLEELSSGLCCGGPCALDDARVWTADDCTLTSELTPIRTLPLRAEPLRVSVNGQQYSSAWRHFGTPSLPRGTSRDLPTPVPGFTYYDPARVTLSAVVPSTGPTEGGTTLTLIGLGFADFGAKVGFYDASGASTGAGDEGGPVFAPATMVHAAFRGRVLSCHTPPWNASGPVSLRLSLNGLEAGLSSDVAFRYEDTSAEESSSGSGDTGSAEEDSGEGSGSG